MRVNLDLLEEQRDNARIRITIYKRRAENYVNKKKLKNGLSDQRKSPEGQTSS